jgi:hypothetical protein
MNIQVLPLTLLFSMRYQHFRNICMLQLLQKLLIFWRKHFVLLKYWQLRNRLYGVIAQKTTAWIIISVFYKYFAVFQETYFLILFTNPKFECEKKGHQSSHLPQGPFWSMHPATIFLVSFCAVCVQRHSQFFLRIPLLDTKCVGLTGHLQVYRLLWLRILLLTVMRVFFPPIVVACGYLVMWVTISFIWVVTVRLLH